MTAPARLAAIAGVGLLTGAITQLGQGALPDGVSQAANAISPWLLVTFLVGSRMPDRGWAAGAGVLTLIGAVVGYYALVQLRFGYGGSTGALVLWSLASLVGGIVYGLGGHAWRTGPDLARAIAIGLMAAVFVAEGVYLMTILPTPAVGAAFALVGAVVPLVLGRSWRDRGRGYVAMVPALALGALGYVALFAVYSVTSGIT